MKLQVENISYTYPNGGRTVLRDFSETFDSSEITALMGQNGCGKTTLTKIITGLIKPDTGTVLLDGDSLSGKTLTQIGRQIGYVMQHPEQQLFCTSVQEEMEYGLKNLKLEKTERERRAAEFLEYFHLESCRDRFPFELSGGERQRLALAVVLAMRPSFLVLDEPTTALDGYRRLLLGQYLLRIRDELGCGILIVSHDRAFVSAYCNRVVCMERREEAGRCTSFI